MTGADRPVRIGAQLQPQHATYAEIRRACAELERRGYAIIARGYRRRVGELDIDARDGRTLVFVEVKAREGRAFGGAAEAVTRPKRRRMRQLALDYVMRHHVPDCPCRFDVVSIHFDAGRPVIEVFQNAFDASSF